MKESRRFVDPLIYESWLARPPLERDPYLLPIDRSLLPPKLEGGALAAWLRRLSEDDGEII